MADKLDLMVKAPSLKVESWKLDATGACAPRRGRRNVAVASLRQELEEGGRDIAAVRFDRRQEKRLVSIFVRL